MSLRRPALSLTVDGRALDAPEAGLLELRADLSTGPVHDRMICAVGLQSPFLSTAAGARFDLSLGYDDSPSPVLSGTVSAVERLPWGAFVEGLAATTALSAQRTGRSYVSQSVADVVNDLVSAGGGTPGQVACDVQLAAFHVDERRSVWQHLESLARLTGSELSCAADGSVDFRAVRSGAAQHTLRHGADLVRWQVGEADRGGDAPTVVPFGAGSEQGADRWHVVLRAPEGSSPKGDVLIPTALRDRSVAQTLEQALAAAQRRRARLGSVVAVGDPSIRPGELVELAEMPSGEDGTYRVLAVSHLFGGGLGYRTLLRLEGAA